MKLTLFTLAVLAALLGGQLLYSPVSAQTETPTPQPTYTPTPSWVVGVTMSTGNTLIIEKKVTYGEIAVVVSVLVLAAINLVTKMVEIPKLWFR